MSDLKAARFRELFGEDNLLRLPLERAHELGLDPETVQAFRQFGLPVHFEELPLQFSLELSRLSVPSHDEFEFRSIGTESSSADDALCKAMGLDNDEPYAWLCINLKNQAIYSVSNVSNDFIQEVSFVNTSLMAFLECLYEFRQTWLHMDEIGDDDEIVIEIIEQLEQKLQVIDPEAFALNFNWWPSFCSGLF